MPEPSSGDASRRLAVTVYGSCVARDTVGLAGGGCIDLVGYVARQSLLSVGSDASAHFPSDARIDSAFQRRMMVGDFRGDALDRLAAAAESTDLVLWDLTDERHGVHVLEDGSIVTRSIDLVRQDEALAVAEQGRHLSLGDDEHFALWSRRAAAFAEELRAVGLFGRTVVLQVPWALVTSDGEPTPWSMGWRAQDANAAFLRYFDSLRALGFTVIELQPLAVLADPGHQWGLAPFHYTHETYEEITRRILEAAETLVER